MGDRREEWKDELGSRHTNGQSGYQLKVSGMGNGIVREMRHRVE